MKMIKPQNVIFKRNRQRRRLNTALMPEAVTMQCVSYKYYNMMSIDGVDLNLLNVALW